MAKKRNRAEHNLQAECVKWYRLRYPKYAKCLFSIPNGGSRNLLEAKSLKKEGVLAGVSDLFLALPNSENSGLFIEMKTPTGGVQETQKEFIKMMRLVGYRAEIVRSFDDFMKVVTEQFKNR